MKRWMAAVCLFTVGAQGVDVSAAVLTLTCSSSKTVLCTSAWAFDEPIASSTCPTGSGYVDWQPVVTVTNGTCPRVVTRTWTVSDYCGNTNSCSQSVTLLDPTPPSALCSGINLIPNHSFENRVNCPQFLGQVDQAVPWYPPTQGTSDYFADCSTNALVDVPGNFGGTQTAYSGTSYMGAIVYRQTGNGPLTSYREYLQAPLLAPLASGVTYRLSFQVSRAEQSPAAVADIGAHFSSAPVVLPGDNFVLPVTPQVVNPLTNLLLSTTNWMLIEGTFAATGGESYVTLGSFQSDAASSVLLTTNVDEYTYYYFDEVSLTAVCDPSVTGKGAICGSPWTFDAPRAVDACSGTNVAVTVAATVTNLACPMRVTRTWLLTDPCGNTNTWSQTVTLTGSGAPQIVCECLADSEIASLNTNSCAGIVPDLTIHTQCVVNPCGAVTLTQQPPAGTTLGPGSHSITVRVENCAGLVSTCVVPFNVYALVPTLALPTNLVVLTCSNSAPVNFIVGGSGHSGAIVCSPPSGSIFTQGVTTVSCVATSACGGVASNTFTVTVKPPRARWFCNLVGVGIGIPYGPLGGATFSARTAGPDYPAIVITPESAFATNSGLTLLPGPADAVTFSTVLTYPAPAGAGFDVRAPPHALNTNDLPLLSIRYAGASGYVVRAHAYQADNLDGTFRTIAVDTNGNLLSSVDYPATATATNPVLTIPAVPGVTSCHITVTYDLQTGRIELGYPGTLAPSAHRKGWDGCIYGPDRPVKKPHARVVIVPPVAPGQPPLTELALRFSGWAEMTVEEPALLQGGRKWSDGHVTLMKAYDDAGERGIDYLAAGPESEVGITLGFASNLSFQIRQLQSNEVSNPQLSARFKGGPGNVTLQIALRPNTALGGVDLWGDFVPWGATNVTLQLWNGGLLVGEMPHVPTGLPIPLATLERFPSRLGMPDPGTVSMGDTNVFLVQGLDCGGGAPCLGTELRLIAEFPPTVLPPQAITNLALGASEGMDLQIYDVQVGPACPVIPVQGARTSNGVAITWSGDGFQLQGAESTAGPWYDLGGFSPVNVSTGAPLRVFRLRCE